ncbi:hypothetical protein [Hymenobacter sp. HDW8]|uniref:hypothetical protein n=1 Tax=Hymenobacter sp. HDW8 TaxID=2714932 RepID=UPI00140A0983|nr:hypothetical protein [Hymenobacter sp. HDW8]QIL78431.1 hypothetical protein G7064_21665 [Hymenobacter sp. HDW8]
MPSRIRTWLLRLLLLLLLAATAFALLQRYFFQSHLDVAPRLVALRADRFVPTTPKPLFYWTHDSLYYVPAGPITFREKPIWQGAVEQAYVAPNGQYILVYAQRTLLLLNRRGQPLFTLDNCTKVIALQEDRRSGRFLSGNIQWSPDSRSFLIAQDRTWVNNFSDQNTTTIWQYTVASRQFTPLVHVDEEVVDDFYPTHAGQGLYYRAATPEGDLIYKYIALATGRSVALAQEDSLAGIFVNFEDYKFQFAQNSYDLAKVVYGTNQQDTVVVYSQASDGSRPQPLLVGTAGYNAFKNRSYSYLANGGYFLPGNRYFVAELHADGQVRFVVLDTEQPRVRRLAGPTTFFFSITSLDQAHFAANRTNGISPAVQYPRY